MEWLLLIPLVVFVVLLMVASDGSQPASLSCQEMKRRYGIPKRRNAYLPGEGYQPTRSEYDGPIAPPPKRP